MFHTVYNSFESKPEGRDYIGKHSTEDPYDDYLGSYRDESFDPDAKIVMAYAKTPQGAVWLEERFQKVFNVVKDPQFANRALQTSTGFDTTGATWVRTAEQRERLRQSFSKPETKERRSIANRGENNPRFGVTEEEEAKKRRLQKVSDFYATAEGFETASRRTRGTIWYHLPDGTERRFDSDPGDPWILGRNEDLGDKVKSNLNPSAGGKVAGKLPWWYNPSSGERCRSLENPGEGWEARKGPNNRKSG